MSNVTSLRMRVLPRFPARITADNGLTIERDNLDLVLKPDFGSLMKVPSVQGADATYFWAWNEQQDAYSSISFQNLVTNIQDVIIGENLSGLAAVASGPNRVPVFVDDEGNATTYAVSDYVQSVSGAVDAEAFLEEIGAATTAQGDKADSAIQPYASVSAATAAIITSSVKRLNTEFFAPSYADPITLSGGAGYRRISFAELTGYPALSWFRSGDRFMPDGSTDETNGGYWLIDEDELTPEMFGARGDNGPTDNFAQLAAMFAVADMIGGFVRLKPGAVYFVKSGALTIPEGVIVLGYDGATIVASAPGIVTKQNTEVAFRPLGGSQARGILVDTFVGSGGVAGANPHSYNVFRVRDDRIDGTLGSGTKVNLAFFRHLFGGAGTKGGRHAIQSSLVLQAATDSDNPDRNYSSAALFAESWVNDGGVDGAAKGALFGVNPQAVLKSGATYFRNVTAGEANVGVESGASTQMRTGWSIVGLGSPVNGYETDAALSISNTGVTGAFWKDGILIGAQNGRPALTSTSNVMRVANIVAANNGIDFDGMTFTTDILRATNVRLRNGSLRISASNAGIIIGNPLAANTPFLDFRSSASSPPNYDARLMASGGGASDGQGDLRAFATNFVTNRIRPSTDNAHSLGDGSFRWSQLFAGTATINTSDERLKTTFRSFTDVEKEAIAACLEHIGIYQWLDAVEEKGDEARLHAGIPAQRCVSEFENRGLDPWRYAWFCRDAKIDVVKRTGRATRQATEQVEIEEAIIEGKRDFRCA